MDRETHLANERFQNIEIGVVGDTIVDLGVLFSYSKHLHRQLGLATVELETVTDLVDLFCSQLVRELSLCDGIVNGQATNLSGNEVDFPGATLYVASAVIHLKSQAIVQWQHTSGRACSTVCFGSAAAGMGSFLAMASVRSRVVW
jgi:hypothetical protein